MSSKVKYLCLGTSQVVLVVKNPPANAGDIRDAGLIPGLGRSPGGGHGNSLQYSCLENAMDRGAWWATVLWVANSQTGLTNTFTLGFPVGSDGKESACNAGDLGSIPESRRSPGVGNSNPLQYSCLENSMDRKAWWATVHGVAKSQTLLSE